MSPAAAVDRPPVLRVRLRFGVVGDPLLAEVGRAVLLEPQVRPDLLHRCPVVEVAVNVVGQQQDVRPAPGVPGREFLGLLVGRYVEVIDLQVAVDADEEVQQLLVELRDQLRRHDEAGSVAQRGHQHGVGLGGVGLPRARVAGIQVAHFPGVDVDGLHLVGHRPVG
ncbi:hypothetical protein D9M70_552970 [compost metagenome]